MKDAMDKKPKKLKSEKRPIWANPEILPFLSLRFLKEVGVNWKHKTTRSPSYFHFVPPVAKYQAKDWN